MFVLRKNHRLGSEDESAQKSAGWLEREEHGTLLLESKLARLSPLSPLHSPPISPSYTYVPVPSPA